MVVELGLFALIVGVLLAGVQAFFGLAGAHFGNRRWMSAARPAVAGQWVFVLLSFLVLAWAFEKQNLNAGNPPAVDVYIDDGRAGEYPYLAAHWGTTTIWNRRNPDGDTETAAPFATSARRTMR